MKTCNEAELTPVRMRSPLPRLSSEVRPSSLPPHAQDAGCCHLCKTPELPTLCPHTRDVACRGLGGHWGACLGATSPLAGGTGKPPGGGGTVWSMTREPRTPPSSTPRMAVEGLGPEEEGAEWKRAKRRGSGQYGLGPAQLWLQ